MNRTTASALIVAALLASAAAGAGFTRLLGHAPDLDDDDAVGAGHADPAPGAGVALTDEQQRQSGLQLARPAPVTTSSAATGYARSLDLSPLAAIAADLAVHHAALTASTREVERLTALVHDDAGASQRELDAARAQAAGDRARVEQSCRRVGLEFGAGLARLGCARIDALAQAAAAGELAVLRIDVPGQTLAAGTPVSVDLAPGAARVTVLGPASAGDAALQSGGALALLRGPGATRAGVGRLLQAEVPGPAGQAGVLIPRAAVVRVDGGLFAWRPADAHHFVRVPLTGATAGERGWTIPAAAWPAGQFVVVAGAGTLLGLEHAAPPAGDD